MLALSVPGPAVFGRSGDTSGRAPDARLRGGDSAEGCARTGAGWNRRGGEAGVGIGGATGVVGSCSGAPSDSSSGRASCGSVSRPGGLWFWGARGRSGLWGGRSGASVRGGSGAGWVCGRVPRLDEDCAEGGAEYRGEWESTLWVVCDTVDAIVERECVVMATGSAEAGMGGDTGSSAGESVPKEGEDAVAAAAASRDVDGRGLPACVSPSLWCARDPVRERLPSHAPADVASDAVVDCDTVGEKQERREREKEEMKKKRVSRSPPSAFANAASVAAALR